MSVMDIFETMDYGPAPEGASPALAWLKEHQPFNLFINNQWVQPASGQYLDSVNPANGKVLTQVTSTIMQVGLNSWPRNCLAISLWVSWVRLSPGIFLC